MFCTKPLIGLMDCVSSVFSGKLYKCLRCPSAYHTGDMCIAAGSQIVAGCNIICGDHFTREKNNKNQQHINTNWCFICSAGMLMQRGSGYSFLSFNLFILSLKPRSRHPVSQSIYTLPCATYFIPSTHCQEWTRCMIEWRELSRSLPPPSLPSLPPPLSPSLSPSLSSPLFPSLKLQDMKLSDGQIDVCRWTGCRNPLVISYQIKLKIFCWQ